MFALCVWEGLDAAAAAEALGVVSAALYRAAARLPGIAVEHDAKDAAGGTGSA